MYRPAQYAVDDVATLHRVLDAYPFATIACANGDGVSFAYAPVVLDAGNGPLGTISFHLARGNPLSAAAGRQVSFSFRGPDAYVSPDWYETSGLVPTWNYIAIEASGTAVRLEDGALRALLVSLSGSHEEKLRPKTPWRIEKLSRDRQTALLGAIVGYSVRLEHLKGKFKLSQEKSVADKSAVIAALEKREDPGAQGIARAMRDFRK